MKFAVLSYFMLAASAISNCGCKEGDVKCIADCTKTPNPTNDMAEKTNDCNTQCTKSGGGDACFSSCVSQNYLANQPNAPTPITSSTTSPTSTTTSTTTDPSKDDDDDKTKTADSDKDDATKPKPTDADKSKTADADKPKPTDATKSKSSDSDKDDKPSSKKSSSSGASKSVPASDTDADSHATLPAVGSIMALALPMLHYLI